MKNIRNSITFCYEVIFSLLARLHRLLDLESLIHQPVHDYLIRRRKDGYQLYSCARGSWYNSVR